MRMSERGQITIPKRIRRMYGLDKNVEVEVLPEEGWIKLQKKPPKRHPVNEVRGIIKLKFADSVDDYIEQIRGR